MSDDLTKWAITEREFLREDIKWLEAGARLLSPGGDDITQTRLISLRARLEHANRVLKSM